MQAAMDILTSLVTVSLTIATMVFAWQKLSHIASMITIGRDESLTDRKPERVNAVMTYVFGQKKVLNDKIAGAMHAMFMYGFLILGIGHTELVLDGATRFLRIWGIQPFLYRNLPMMPDILVQLYELSQDFMAMAVVVVSVAALARRFSGKVPRLMPRSLDAEIILWFILFLYIFFFGMIGAETYLRQHGHEAGAALSQGWLWHLPFSSIVAMMFGAMGHLPPEMVVATKGLFWWAHLLVFLGFGAYVPTSKHMHLVWAGPNIYFRHFDAVAKPSQMDFMDENATKFGSNTVQDLSWKTLLDTFACTECGRCNSVCPAHLSGKPLQPKKVLHDIKINLFENEKDILKFRTKDGSPIDEEKAAEELEFEWSVPLIGRDEIDHDDPEQVRADGKYLKTTEGSVHMDEMWACTTCAACVEACPVLIDSVPVNLMEMRRYMVLTEGELPDGAEPALRGIENQGNPWGVGQDKRMDWAEELDVPVLGELEEGKSVEYLFWVGCAGSTDDDAKKTQKAMVRILKAAGVDYAVLGCEEKCTGDPARRMGNEYVFDALAQENVEVLNTYQKAGKFKKIFATCPHCFNSLQHEYKDYGGDYEVFHHTQLIGELMKDGRIPMETRDAIKEHVTFHDPCYLGRYNKEYDAPRDTLVSLPGLSLSEMDRTKEESFCCGAGGGRMFMEEHIGKRVNVERTDQALATGAQTIAVGCPFCKTMIKDGTKARDKEEDVKVKDIAELVAERVKAHLPAKSAEKSDA